MRLKHGSGWLAECLGREYPQPTRTCFLPPCLADADLKAALYKDLGIVVSPTAIMASNTSGLEIGWLAGHFGRRDNVIGLHYFNPVQIMQASTHRMNGACACT